MADKKLSIEVESKQTGSGLKDTAADAAKLEQQLEKAKDASQKFAGELNDAGKAAEKLEADQESLTGAIFKSEMAFEKAQSASIALKSEYKSLARSGQATKEELEELSGQISVAEDKETQAIITTRNLMKQYAQLKGETGDVSKEHEELSLKLGHAEGYITGVTNKARLMSKDMNALAGSVDKVGDEMNQVGGEVQTVGNKVDRATGEIRQLGDTAARSSQSLDKLVKNGPHMVAFGNILSDMFRDAARYAGTFAKESHEAFLNYDRGMREVFTLLPEASGQMREALSKDARLLGTELGRLPEEMNEAMYMALSLGIPEDNVLDAVRLSSEAARAGVSELSTTLTTGQSIVNAYGDEVIGLERVYDLLFFTVKNGAITIPELNGVMSEITSVAGEVGVGLEEISAALIVMTKQGDTASEASGLLSNVLTQLSITGTALGGAFKEAAGVGFKEFIAGGGNLAQAMKILQEYSAETGIALGEMVGGSSPFFRDQQAMRGTLELTGRHLDDLIKYTNEAIASNGMMGEAAAEMGEAAELGSLRAKAALEEYKIALGEAANPFMTKLYEGAAQFLTLWSGNKASGVQNLVDDLVDADNSTTKWIASLGRLQTTTTLATQSIQSVFVDSATKNLLRENLDEAYRSLAATSGSFDEFLGNLDKAGVELDELYSYMANSGDTRLISMSAEEFYKLAQAEAEAARQAEALARVDEIMLQKTWELNEGIQVSVGGYNAYTEASEAYIVTAERVAEAETRRAEKQQELMGYYYDSYQPINDLIYAEEQLATMSGTWSEEHEIAQQRVTDANTAVTESFKTMAFEAVLAQSGISESTLALAVEMGIMTEQQAAQRWEFVQTSEAIAQLTANQDFLALSAQQQATAVDLVISGMATTHTQAIALAGAYDQHLSPSMATSQTRAEGLLTPLRAIAEGDFSAVVKVSTGNSGSLLSQLKERIAAIKSKTVTVTVKTESKGGTKSAAEEAETKGFGGPVRAGTAYLVGDDKGKITPYTELFVPSTDGMILPPDQTRDLLTNFSEPTPVSAFAPADAPGGTSTQSLTIQVQVNGYREDLAERIGDDTKMKVIEAAKSIGFAI